MKETINNHFSKIAFATLGYVGGAEYGLWQYPEIPEQWPLAAMAAAAAIGGGYVAAGKIFDLLPDEEGIFLVAFECNDESGGAVYELSEDKFENMTVLDGTLFQWDVGRRVYECRTYDPESNVATANWRESIAGSHLAGNQQVIDAMEQITELREEFEPAAERYRTLQRRLWTVARELDKRRAQDMESALAGDMTPTFDDDEATVTEVLRSELPEHLKPESMNAGEQTEMNGDTETVGFEFLEDGEDLQPTDEVEP